MRDEGRRMNAVLGIGALVFCVFAVQIATGQKCRKYTPKPQKAECKQYKSIATCPLTGCGNDEEADLNRQKNISDADLTTAVDTSLQDLRKMTKPDGYGADSDRTLLVQAGEGNVVRTAGWLTDIRSGSQESCNCYLSKPKDTDNHMVLVNDFVINNFDPKDWEDHSFTAEFTPRVKRKGHKNFKCDKIRPMIFKDPRKRLMVRLTGTLLFDNFHEFSIPLHRETNWEIHPVFKFEYCPHPNKCKLDEDAGWKDIDQ
jgi:hypothetical protein